MSGQSQHGPADCPALAARKIIKPPQPGQKVQRSRQPAAGGEIITRAVGTEEVQRRVAIEAVGGFRAAAEIQQVRAAAHGHVRRKIDELIGLGVVIRAGPAARRRGLLEQFDVETLLHRRHGRRQSGHAAANDGDGRLRRGRGSGGHGMGQGRTKSETGMSESRPDYRVPRFKAKTKGSKRFWSFRFRISILFRISTFDFGFHCVSARFVSSPAAGSTAQRATASSTGLRECGG